MPSAWVVQARTRLEALGADARPLAEEAPEVAAEPNGDSSYAMDNARSTSSKLLLSGRYNHDGYWPPLRPDPSLGSGRRRPATGYDERLPGVIDRLFSSPIAQGTTEKEIRKVKESMNRKTIVAPRTTSARISCRDAARGEHSDGDMLAATTGRLRSVATTIFNEEEDKAKLAVETKNIQKLTYAEKLQVMIMQVQDTLKYEGDV